MGFGLVLLGPSKWHTVTYSSRFPRVSTRETTGLKDNIEHRCNQRVLTAFTEPACRGVCVFLRVPLFRLKGKPAGRPKFTGLRNLKLYSYESCRAFRALHVDTHLHNPHHQLAPGSRRRTSRSVDVDTSWACSQNPKK